MILTKDQFESWAYDEKDQFDDELVITHDPKISSKSISDEILLNQTLIIKIKEIITKFDHGFFNPKELFFQIEELF